MNPGFILMVNEKIETELKGQDKYISGDDVTV